jgi:hypothetical protein
MQGWLVVVTVSRLQLDTPPVREIWAVSVADEHRAVALVVEKSGGTVPQPIYQLNQATLEGLGIRRGDAVVRVVAEDEAHPRT